jgi:hypothetical protein
MLWLIVNCDTADVSQMKKLVLAACRCARLALPFVRVGEDRPRLAIEAAEAWTRGEVSIDKVRPVFSAAANAADDSWDANDLVSESAATAAAVSSAAVADAVCAFYAVEAAAKAAAYATAKAAAAADAAAKTAARAAAYYADAAADAAVHAAAEAARIRVYAQCADIVREIFSGPPELGGKV